MNMAMLETQSTRSEIESLLFEFGWPWGQDLLKRICSWLEDQGLNKRLDLVELDLGDLRNANQWDAQVGDSVCVCFM